MTANDRAVDRVVPAVPSTDVPGLALSRMIATPHLDMLDPFLLLSDFEPAAPGRPVGGFGDHPHRGFETVTYMIAGAMQHRDHTGNEGLIGPGGVQWMTAGRGIIHAETPVTDAAGNLRGFQLWTNLPAAEKLRQPAYQEYDAENVPSVILDGGIMDGGAEVRVIAGSFGDATGPVTGIGAAPVFLDITLPAAASVPVDLPADHNAFIYVIDGAINVGEDTKRSVKARHLAVLSPGDLIRLTATADAPARVLLAAAAPIGEPVARYGPFVMNSREEIVQAVEDFQAGRF